MGKLLDNTVTELNSWVAKDRGAEGEQQFSLEKMESTLGELKNIFKEKESWWKTCNFPKLCVSILQILSEEDHLIIIHFVVEVLVSTHLFFNLIALINLLSMDIDSFLALPHPNQNICMHWSGVYTYHRNYL